eukprot:gene928-235_t
MHYCLLSDTELKQKGRGSFCFQTDQNAGLSIVKWYDNKPVHLVSTYIGVQADETVKRFDRKRKMHVQVECPNVVKRYNKSMRGIDLADMLIALYRMRIKTKRWYLSLIFHSVDIAKVNAWLLYGRYANQLKIPKAKRLSLLGFISEISQSLIKAEKASPAPRFAGRPPKRSMICEEETRAKRGCVPKVALLDIDSRFDQYGHWPEHKEKKNMCRHCRKGYSREDSNCINKGEVKYNSRFFLEVKFNGMEISASVRASMKDHSYKVCLIVDW